MERVGVVGGGSICPLLERRRQWESGSRDEGSLERNKHQSDEKATTVSFDVPAHV